MTFLGSGPNEELIHKFHITLYVYEYHASLQTFPIKISAQMPSTQRYQNFMIMHTPKHKIKPIYSFSVIYNILQHSTSFLLNFFAS